MINSLQNVFYEINQDAEATIILFYYILLKNTNYCIFKESS